MQSPHLPGLLEGRGRESGISMERALKQVLELLETIEPQTEEEEDKLEASIGDVEMMIRRVRN